MIGVVNRTWSFECQIDPVRLTTGVNPDGPFLLGGERACGIRGEVVIVL